MGNSLLDHYRKRSPTISKRTPAPAVASVGIAPPIGNDHHEKHPQSRTSGTAKPTKIDPKTFKPNAETKKLAKAIGFTAKDLIFNIQGLLSLAQYKRIKKQSLIDIILSPIFIMALGILQFYLVSHIINGTYIDFVANLFNMTVTGTRWEGMFWVMSVFPGMLAVGAGMILFRSIHTRYRLRTAKVDVYEGPIRTDHKVVKSRYGNQEYFYIYAGPKKFEVTETIFEVFRNGKVYMIHYLPHHPAILSAIASDNIF
ncbi:MAG: hypothetical protein H6670_12775 [Anaerolineaceae bacterium]|nr:hypothetical protein [Anaerolineaceae bacterium]